MVVFYSYFKINQMQLDLIIQLDHNPYQSLHTQERNRVID